MNLLKFYLLVFVILFQNCSQQNESETVDDVSKRPDIYQHSSAESNVSYDQPEWLAERLEWFEDQKFGILFSWGQCVVWGGHQSWCISPDAPWARPDDWEPWIERKKDLTNFTKDYFNLYKQFNPVKFNPDKWAELAEYAGVKYIGITTKHHDGFCLFDTRTTDFKITSKDSPFYKNPRANLTKEIFDAFRSRGMGISCYFSKSDWYTPYYWNPKFPIVDRNVNYVTKEHPELWNKFKDYTYTQIEELMKEYGEIDILWLDGGQVRPPYQDIDMPKIAKMARSYQEKLIIVDRTVGGKYENIITPEQHIPAEPIEHTWEACATIQRNGWTWRENVEYRSTKELIHMLIDIVSKGGNFFLGVGPNQEGELDPRTISRLKEIGDWMQINGEAIHNTRRWINFAEGENIRFVRTKDWKYLYVHVLEFPGKELRLKNVRPIENTDIRLLGYPSTLRWNIENENLVIELPKELLDEKNGIMNNALVFKMEAHQPALTPTITPKSKIFTQEGIKIHIHTESKNAKIFYTLDGSFPDRNSNLYDKPFVIYKSSKINAITYKEDIGYSQFASASFVKKGQIFRNIELLSQQSKAYLGDGKKGLNDGIKASDDYQHPNWMGFEEDDFQIILDLGESKSINRISSSFLQDQQKWIFFPSKVDYYSSEDGEKFSLITSFNEKLTNQTKTLSKFYMSKPLDIESRYVKIVAQNIKTCPSWHIGAGGKAWLFVDEVVVE